LEPFGKANGYQHLWKEASALLSTDNSKISWLNEGSFYTLTSIAQPNDEVFFVRIGANDPSFNLRREPGIIFRKNNTQKATFVSVLETHGNYKTVTELATNSSSNIASLKVVYEDLNYIGVEIKSKSGAATLFVLATKNNKANQKHRLQINNKTHNWVGAYYKTTIK
jgi:hypothetical protein